MFDCEEAVPSKRAGCVRVYHSSPKFHLVLAGCPAYAILLVAGWNLISLPVIPNDPTTPTLLSTQLASGNAVVVWGYGGTPTWKFFRPTTATTFTGTLTTMIDGYGYWIYMRRADTLHVAAYVIFPGSLPPSYSLGAGWNLVGFKPQPTTTTKTVSAYLASIDTRYDHNNVWVFNK